MDNCFTPKNAGNFECIKCNFICSKKSDYNRHLLTSKHKRITNDKNFTPKNATAIYVCKCGKEYKYQSGLSKHKKSCNFQEEENTIVNESKDEMKDLVFKLINENNEIKNTLLKENQELRNQIREQNQQITELIPKIGNNNNNINNKNKFNINVFLNEKCKDALSIDEFIENIDISIKNLLITREKGQIEGITDIIMENINKLSLYERPVHCTDKKRETLYIKYNEWQKDEDNKQISEAIKKIEKKQLKNVKKWLEVNPDYNNNTIKQQEFTELIKESSKTIDSNNDKIIKTLCKELYVDK